MDSMMIRQEVDSLSHLAVTLLHDNKIDSSKAVLDDVTAIIKKNLGDQCREFALNLDLLGDFYLQNEQVDQAEQSYRMALALGEKTLKTDDPKFIEMLSHLSESLQRRGHFDEAELLLIRAKECCTQIPDYSAQPFYTSCLTELIVIYQQTSQLEKGEGVCLQLLKLLEQQHKQKTSSYLHALNNLALIYNSAGLYEKAEKTYLSALSVLEYTEVNKLRYYAPFFINLGLLCYYTGRHREAEQYYLKAKDIYENQLKDTTDEFYANCIFNLALLYLNKGSFDKALSLLNITKDIDERTIGKQHPYYAMGLEAFADCYEGKGDWVSAEDLLKTAEQIKEAALGIENPETAASLFKLANLYRKQGRFQEAQSYYTESISIIDKTLGKRHRNYLEFTNEYLKLLRKTKQQEKVCLLSEEAAAINRIALQQGARYLSEAELSAFASQFEQNLHFYFSIANQYAMINPTLSASCYDDALCHKGFLLQASAKIRNTTNIDKEAAEKLELLNAYRRRLANIYSQPIAYRDSALIANLEFKANSLEKDLVSTVAGYDEAIRQVSWREVKAALKPGEAAIEFIHYHFSNPDVTDSTLYAALVLKPEDIQPRFVPLFEEKSIDSLLRTAGERKGDYVNSVYAVVNRGVKPAGRPQKSLYELIWQPMEKDIQGVKTIFFSPDGLLHRLNLAAIPIDMDSILADRYRLIELGSTRQLAVRTTASTPEAGSALLLGGIQYDMDSTAITAANRQIDSVLVASRGELSFSYVDSTLRMGTWPYLKWTAREALGIQAIIQKTGMPVQMRQGYTATEEAFKSMGQNGQPSPRILHIATHGFFFPDPENKEQKASGIGEEPIFKISDHPMIRSGLLLAGANHAWQTGKPLHPDMEDGILTAYEISQMNLSNTELVVLSACETGLGDIHGNEGVYGLQRAFKIAGAKYLMMSLWQIPDRETMEFMTAFYRNWLLSKMSIPDAFRTTHKEMRERFINPYLWAGFVLLE